MVCKRYDIHWVELDPARGSELRKTRPAVIVSLDVLIPAAPFVVESFQIEFFSELFLRLVAHA
jgi:mRNA-degrading endonuclease toxin of MazEF toxin-antitoxin module